jgi:hypothetical protein
LIYHNVAQREDDEAARPGNAGERLAYARLPTGVRVIGVNSGYTLSFIKDVAEEFRWASSPAKGSQFRSRDVFPQAAAAIALELSTALGDEIDAHALPPPPSSVIAYVDGYGNLKTTLAYDAKKIGSGKRIGVRVNDHEHEATVSDGCCHVKALTGCGTTRLMHTMPLESSKWRRCHNSVRMLKKATVLTRPAPARQDAPFRGQGRSERRGGGVRFRYVEPLSDARTPLADFFSILLKLMKPASLQTEQAHGRGRQYVRKPEEEGYIVSAHS